LKKIDIPTSHSERDKETLLKIENKYNIILGSELAEKKRKDQLEKNKKITIPRPFTFVDKKKENKTIMQMKLERMLEEKEKEIKTYENWRFKANPVPAECLVPLLNSIDKDRDHRIQTFKEFNATKNKMKVFSFVERDKEKEKSLDQLRQKYDIQHEGFKAKQVPAHVTVKLYDEITNKREKERLQNIERRKAWLKKISQLPERMKKAEEESKNKKRAKDDSNLLYDYVPKINHEVPDFKKLHDEFEKKLQSKKAVHEKVIPVEFNVTKRDKSKTGNKNIKLNESTNDINDRLNRSHTMKNFEKSLNSFNKAKAEGEKVSYKSTKKMEDIKNLRMKEKMDKEKELNEEKLKQEIREKKYQERKNEFKEKMRNYRMEEEEKIKNFFSQENKELITVETINENVKKKKIGIMEDEDTYKI